MSPERVTAEASPSMSPSSTPVARRPSTAPLRRPSRRRGKSGQRPDPRWSEQLQPQLAHGLAQRELDEDHNADVRLVLADDQRLQLSRKETSPRGAGFGAATRRARKRSRLGRGSASDFSPGFAPQPNPSIEGSQSPSRGVVIGGQRLTVRCESGMRPGGRRLGELHAARTPFRWQLRYRSDGGRYPFERALGQGTPALRVARPRARRRSGLRRRGIHGGRPARSAAVRCRAREPQGQGRRASR